MFRNLSDKLSLLPHLRDIRPYERQSLDGVVIVFVLCLSLE